MNNSFTLFDLANLIESFNSASSAHDCLAVFLNSYKFKDVYETADDSLVFDAGDENDISIEFFNFENPLTRTMSIMYWENKTPVILNY